MSTVKQLEKQLAIAKRKVENQKRLREYIKILKENYELGFVKDDGGNFNHFDLYIKYFIILHNFLLVENQYFDIVKLSNKEINRYLNLPKLESLDEVINKFKELYDTNSKVRFGVETFDSIEEIRLLLPQLKDFYNKIYKSLNVSNDTFSQTDMLDCSI